MRRRSCVAAYLATENTLVVSLPPPSSAAASQAFWLIIPLAVAGGWSKISWTPWGIPSTNRLHASNIRIKDVWVTSTTTPLQAKIIQEDSLPIARLFEGDQPA